MLCKKNRNVKSRKVEAKLLIRVMLSAVLLLSLGLTGLEAQEVISSSGGEASGNGGSASYTVGQVFYTTNSGTDGTVSQGVQQAFEISVVIGIEEAKGINLIVSAYPNPTIDFLTLKIDASTTININSLSYQLYDLKGSLLENKMIESDQTSIAMRELIPATYFLRIMHANSQREIKTFKIIKK